MSKKIGSVLFFTTLLLSAGLLLYSMQFESEESQVKVSEEAMLDDVHGNLVEKESEDHQVASTIDSSDEDDSQPDSISLYDYDGRGWTAEELAAAHPDVYAAFTSWENEDGSFRDDDTPLYTMFDIDLESTLAHYDGIQDNGTQNKVGISDFISEDYPEHVPLMASLASDEYNAERDAALIEAGHQFICEERYWNVKIITGGDTEDGILLEVLASAGSDACERRDGYFRENWLIVDGNLELVMRADEFVPYQFPTTRLDID